MYYLLASDYQLVGYRKLPFAVHDLSSGETRFLNREQFGILYHCDGQHDFAEEPLGEGGKKYLSYLLEKKIISAAETQGKPGSYREYIYYDNRFKQSVQWSVTGKCNYRCKHCFMSAPDAKYGHPTKEQCFDFIRQLEECGIKNVTLTGGEPLVRSDFMELVEALTKHHVRITGILTNGMLVNDALLDGLEFFHQHPFFQMSYDGKGWHDWMRGINGAEETVLRAFRLLRDRGYDTSSTMSVHKKSVGTLRESVLTLRDAGCRALKVNVAHPSGEWVRYPEYFLTMDEAYRAYLDYIPQYFEDDAPLTLMLEDCFAYMPGAPAWNMVADKNIMDAFDAVPVCAELRKTVYVAPEGDVLPCQSMIGSALSNRYPNVFQMPLREILTDSAYLNDVCSDLSAYMAKNPECEQCPHAAHCCGGCRAMGVGADGDDFFAPDRSTCGFYRNGWHKKFRETADRAFARFKESGGIERAGRTDGDYTATATQGC